MPYVPFIPAKRHDAMLLGIRMFIPVSDSSLKPQLYLEFPEVAGKVVIAIL